jgi:signal transduction histidine kinase
LLEPWRIDRLPVVGLGLLAIAAVCFGWSTAIGARQSILEQKRRTEAELIRLDRMASLGTLVAGLAHELNTPIGNAVTVASTLAQRVAQLEPEIAAGRIRRTTLDEFLVEMREGTALLTRGVERAADLIRHFKQLAVDQASAQRRTFRMTDIVDDVVSTLETQFKNSPVSLKTKVTTHRELDGYPGLLGQALTNLANNALVHGFDDGQSGTVTITARSLPGDKVEIAVRDTGKGMAPDIRKHAFEPFFTTRLGSGGSGLGLSIVHNIVTTVLGGSIRIESDPGTGTVVYMQLPVNSPGDKNPHTEKVYNVHRPPAP